MKTMKTMKNWSLMALMIVMLPMLTACPDDPVEPTPIDNNTEDTTTTTPQGRAEFTYNMNVSPDLLLFVTPQVTFFNGAGAEESLELTDQLWTVQDSGMYVLNGDSVYYARPWKWENTVKYTSWGKQCGMLVKYLPKENVEIEDREYNLDRRVYCTSASTFGSHGIQVFSFNTTTLNITITIGGQDNQQENVKQEVRNYIDELVATTDSVLLDIDENDRVTLVK